MKSFEVLTPDQRADICNGCGGKGAKIKPPHAILFAPDCNKHDYDYFLGCKETDRLKADWKLRSRMRDRIKTVKIEVLRDHLYINDRFFPGWLVRQIFFRWADAYCIGVMIAGRKFFYYGDEPQEV